MTVTNTALSKEVESDNMFVAPNAKKKTKIGTKKKQVLPEPPPPPKKPEKKVPEGRKYAQIAPESVKIKAECVGIDDLDDAVAKALSEEVSYRLREIISKTTIYMRQTKCTKLSRAHLKSVFVANDLEYTLGHLTPPTFNLLEEPEIFVQVDSTDNLEEMVDLNLELEQLQPKIRGKIVLPDKEIKPVASNKKITNETESVEAKTVLSDKQTKPTPPNKKLETEPLEEVEKYPELYNYKLKGYSRKEVTERSWHEVAKEVNLSANECKEKWKKLQSIFVHHMKPPPKCFAEAEENIPKPISPPQPPPPPLLPPPPPPSSTTSLPQQDMNRIPKSARSQLLKQKKRSHIDTKKKKLCSTDLQGKRTFLLSLLPEINPMTETQMKLFRRRVLHLIDDIMCCDKPQIESQQTPMETSIQSTPCETYGSHMTQQEEQRLDSPPYYEVVCEVIEATDTTPEIVLIQSPAE